MNENFENDELLAQLKKSAKTIRAPKLDESILENASASTTKTTWREKLALASNRSQFSLVGAAAAVAVLAISVSSLQAPNANIRITLGSSASGESRQSDQALTGSSKMGAAYWSQWGYEYFAGEDISKDEGTGNIYRVVGSKSAEEMAKLLKDYFAVAGNISYGDLSGLGITGEDEGFAPSAGGPTTSTANLTNGGKSIYVSSQTVPYFSYFNEAAYKLGKCIKWNEAKVPVDEVGNPTEESDPTNTDTTYCQENAFVEPTLPTQDDAKSEAVEVFGALGLRVTKSDIQVKQMTDTMWATAPVKLNGKPIGFNWSITWGNTGEIYTIDGVAAKFDLVGTVQTISNASAVERLSDYRWRVSADESLTWGTILSAYHGVGTEPKNGEVFEPIKKKVIKAIVTAGTLTDASGQMWIVPSVALYSDMGIAGIVTNVASGVLELPEFDSGMGGEVAR